MSDIDVDVAEGIVTIKYTRPRTQREKNVIRGQFGVIGWGSLGEAYASQPVVEKLELPASAAKALAKKLAR